MGPPIDPSNDADQHNGKLEQEAKNKPQSSVENKNVNFNPQFTIVGDNNSSIDQSQHAGALQLNVLGQAIGLG